MPGRACRSGPPPNNPASASACRGAIQALFRPRDRDGVNDGKGKPVPAKEVEPIDVRGQRLFGVLGLRTLILMTENQGFRFK